MLGPFPTATASRRTPPVLHCHSPGVATVARRLQQHRRQRVTEGPLWPHRMGPMNLVLAKVYNRLLRGLARLATVAPSELVIC